LDALIRNSKSATFAGCDVSGFCMVLTLVDNDDQTWDIVWSTPANQNGRISVNNYLLSDTNLVSGVDVEQPCTGCGFKKLAGLLTAPSTAPDIIGVKFIFQQGKKASTRQDFQANVTFERTISLKSSL